MSRITGKAKKFDGAPVDYVLLFDWLTGDCIGKSIPDSAGNWRYLYNKDLNVGITYVANGCEPITHGAYSFVSEPLEQGMILGYSFNGNTEDASINGLDGTRSGTTSFVEGRKQGTQALKFEDGSIKTSSPLVINSNKLTISCWLKLSNFSDAQLLFSGGDITREDGSYYIMINNTAAPSLDVVTKTGVVSNSNHVSTLRRLTDSNWHHFLFMIDRAGSEVSKIYIDDVKTSLEVRFSQTQSGNFRDFILNIGKLGSTYPYKGLMQDLKIYNRLLTDIERTALFNE